MTGRNTNEHDAIQYALWDAICDYVEEGMSLGLFKVIVRRHLWWLRHSKTDQNEFLSLFTIELLQLRNDACAEDNRLSPKEIARAAERARWRIRREVDRLLKHSRVIDSTVSDDSSPKDDTIAEEEYFHNVMTEIRSYLSDNELVMLSMKVEGTSVREIAHQFGLSKRQAYYHINRILNKLRIHLQSKRRQQDQW